MKFLKLLILLAQLLRAQDVWAQEEPNLDHGGEDDEDSVEDQDEDEIYDPDNEPLDFPCRRDPTWRRHVDYDTCQELAGWYPDDAWWKLDQENNEMHLGENNDVRLTECLDKAFEDAKENYDWATCDENNRTEICDIEVASVMGHYFREDQGQLMSIANVLSEQEAFGIEALQTCIREILPNELPFYEVREFQTDEAEQHGMFNEQGGNFCTYFQGLLQLYLPGVTASIYNAVQQVYDEALWDVLEFPQPSDLGLRTAEYLSYRTTGKLGHHVDSGSIFSISVALSDVEDYSGGYFHLLTEDALFKVPRLSAIVFFSESSHAITQIASGERKVFVVELWEDEDTPVGMPRPDAEQFDQHKEDRFDFLPELEEVTDEEADATKGENVAGDNEEL